MKKSTLTLTQAGACEILANSDHAFINAEYSVAIAAAFGLDVKPQVGIIDAEHPKGLTSPGKKHGDAIEGYDAADLAEAIAHHLDKNFSPYLSGRGFRLRAACRVIEKHVADNDFPRPMGAPSNR